MTHQVTIANTGRTFAVEADETILDAALRSGLRIRYGCRRGKCATCKHAVLEGEIDDREVSAYALLDDEREEGLTLLCKTYARSDCVVELLEFGGDDGVAVPPPRAVVATIAATDQLTPSIWSVVLELAEPLEFLAGQYVEIEVPGQPGTTRSYSIASTPSSPSRLEVLVTRIDGGAFSGQLGTLAPGTPTMVHGPFGSMFLRPGDRPVVLVGAGSGLGPLLGIARDLAETRDGAPARPARLFYGARTVAEIPCRDELAALASGPGGLEVLITLSRPAPGDAWDGPVGRVQALLGHEFGSAHDVDGYVCGPPVMCDDVALFLEARGVATGRIHTDGFYAAEEDGDPR